MLIDRIRISMNIIIIVVLTNIINLLYLLYNNVML